MNSFMIRKEYNNNVSSKYENYSIKKNQFKNNDEKYTIDKTETNFNEWTTTVRKSDKKKSNFYYYNNKNYNFNKKYNEDKKYFSVYETYMQYQYRLKSIDTKEINNYGDKNCDWVYKIFEGKKELDNVVCVTKEFLIVTNNGKTFEETIKNNPNKFTLVVLLFDLEIRTIRDLEKKHIELLLRMKQKSLEVINNYLKNVSDLENKLIFEFHYTPSTYQLHLNVKLNKKPETEEIRKQRIYLLDTVIENLESDSDYYKKPIKILVENISDWEKNLLEWSKIDLDIISKNKYNFETLEFWKFFEQMDCYKNYIDKN